MKKTTEIVSRLISDEILLETKSGNVKISTDEDGKLNIGSLYIPGNENTLIVDPVNNCVTASCLSVGVISASQYVGPIGGGGGGSPASPNNSVQFNNGGSFGGSSNLTFNPSTNILSGSQATFVRITGSFSGSGRNITNITASNISNFTNDVRGQFSAGTNITIVGGVISSTGGGGTPGGTNTTIQFNSGSTFSGSTNLVYDYTNNILSGTTAQFTSITGSHSGSGAGLFGIPNTGLTNSSLTIGSTNIALGSTATTIQGISVLTGSTVTGSTALFTTVTGTFSAPRGSFSAPAYSFTGDSDTGLFSSGSNVINMAAGGSEIFRALYLVGGPNIRFGGMSPAFNGLNYVNSTVNSGSALFTAIAHGDSGTFAQESSRGGAFNGARSRGSNASPVAVGSNDSLANYGGLGYNGSAYFYGANMVIKAEDTYNATSNPGRFEFYTAQSGSTSTTIRMIISGSGDVTIGKGSSPANARLDVLGNTTISGNLNITGSSTFTTVSGTTAQFTTVTGSNIRSNYAFISGNVDISGTLTAIAKSFDIQHPSIKGMRLRYGSLEGPENGVYVRGLSTSSFICLPEYWINLVDENSITVSITPIGVYQNFWIDKIENNKVYVSGKLEKYYFHIFAERKDIGKLVVEY
jgi:hypothetical protein